MYSCGLGTYVWDSCFILWRVCILTMMRSVFTHTHLTFDRQVFVRGNQIPTGYYGVHLTGRASSSYTMPTGTGDFDGVLPGTPWTPAECSKRKGKLIGVVRIGVATKFSLQKTATTKMGPWARLDQGNFVHPILGVYPFNNGDALQHGGFKAAVSDIEPDKVAAVNTAFAAVHK